MKKKPPNKIGGMEIAHQRNYGVIETKEFLCVQELSSCVFDQMIFCVVAKNNIIAGFVVEDNTNIVDLYIISTRALSVAMVTILYSIGK